MQTGRPILALLRPHGVLNAYHVFLLYLANNYIAKLDLVPAEAMQTCPGFFLKSLLEISWNFVQLNL